MAPLPVVCCLAIHACHVAATDCSAAGIAGAAATVAVGVALPHGEACPRVSSPQVGAVATPSVSGTWFGTAVKGVMSGVLENAPYIGVAAASFWFSGWAPRICSMVRTIVICE